MKKHCAFILEKKVRQRHGHFSGQMTHEYKALLNAQWSRDRSAVLDALNKASETPFAGTGDGKPHPVLSFLCGRYSTWLRPSADMIFVCKLKRYLQALHDHMESLCMQHPQGAVKVPTQDIPLCNLLVDWWLYKLDPAKKKKPASRSDVDEDDVSLHSASALAEKWWTLSLQLLALAFQDPTFCRAMWTSNTVLRDRGLRVTHHETDVQRQTVVDINSCIFASVGMTDDPYLWGNARYACCLYMRVCVSASLRLGPGGHGRSFVLRWTCEMSAAACTMHWATRTGYPHCIACWTLCCPRHRLVMMRVRRVPFWICFVL